MHDIVFNENGKYQSYNLKLLSIINDKNTNQLAQELLVRPNLVFSLIEKDGSFVHGLDFVGKIGHEKMMSLYLDCLFHFGEIVLNQKLNQPNSDSSPLFLQKVLNFDPIYYDAVSDYELVKCIV